MASGPDVNSAVSPAPIGGQPVYYRTDLTKASLGEIWRCASPSYLAFFAGVVRKLFRQPTRAALGWAAELTTIIELGDVPERATKVLAGVMRACETQGLAPRFGVKVPGVGDQEACNIVFSNKDGTLLATAAYTRVGSTTEIAGSVLSLLRDGRVVCTTSARPRLNGPPENVTWYRAGGSVPDLLRWHKVRLKELGAPRLMPLDDLARRQFMLDLAERNFHYLRQRGLWVAMSDAEAERLGGAAGN